MFKNNKHGFTLIELLVVIAIISILAAILFPVFARASFGIYGANIPAILRAIVAVAWYGIQTYLASAAVMLGRSIFMRVRLRV